MINVPAAFVQEVINFLKVFYSMRAGASPNRFHRINIFECKCARFQVSHPSIQRQLPFFLYKSTQWIALNVRATLSYSHLIYCQCSHNAPQPASKQECPWVILLRRRGRMPAGWPRRTGCTTYFQYGHLAPQNGDIRCFSSCDPASFSTRLAYMPRRILFKNNVLNMQMTCWQLKFAFGRGR